MEVDKNRPMVYASVPDKELWKNSNKLKDSYFSLLFLSDRIKEKMGHTEYQQFSRAVAEIGEVVAFISGSFDTWCKHEDYEKWINSKNKDKTTTSTHTGAKRNGILNRKAVLYKKKNRSRY